MHYVLFETAETLFFDSIAEKYCERFANWIRKTYQAIKREDSRINQDELDAALKRHLKSNRGHLQCLFFFTVAKCENASCTTQHQCVLTRRQLKTVVEKLKTQKTAISQNEKKISIKDRIFFQSFYEQCSNHVNEETVCVSVYHQSHQKYLKDYVDYVNRKLASPGHCFTYVRGADSSDYDYFSKSIRSLAVVSCDEFRAEISAS
jgi:hypothetical protein